MGISQQIGASSLIKPGVIDNTAARPASPYEGQVIFQKDTDQLLVWNGTAWVIPNSPAQNPQGLELVTTCTVTSTGGTAATVSAGVVTVGTSNTSVTIQNCFNSTYDAYEIVLSNVDGSTATSALVHQLVDSGGTAATTNYKSTGFFMTYVSTTVNGINQTTWETSLSATNYGGKVSIFNPFLTVPTYFNNTTTDDTYLRVYGGTHTTASSYVSLKLAPNTGTITGGTIRVYGFRNS